jgi:hypothetical protein
MLKARSSGFRPFGRPTFRIFGYPEHHKAGKLAGRNFGNPALFSIINYFNWLAVDPDPIYGVQGLTSNLCPARRISGYHRHRSLSDARVPTASPATADHRFREYEGRCR